MGQREARDRPRRRARGAPVAVRGRQHAVDAGDVGVARGGGRGAERQPVSIEKHDARFPWLNGTCDCSDLLGAGGLVSSELNGKVALVTGASRGLGEGAARALAAAGCRGHAGGARWRAGRRAWRATSRPRAARADAMACDVSDYAAVEKRRRRHQGAAGRARHPGQQCRRDRAHCRGRDLRSRRPGRNNIPINLIGAYNVVRAVLPGMLAKGGGTIVNVSSGAAYRPLEGWSAYCAGKAGLAMLTRSIALETAGKGIRVFGFSPGTIDTEMQVKIRASGHEHDQPDPARQPLAGRACGARAGPSLHHGERRPDRPGRLDARRGLPRPYRVGLLGLAGLP